MNSEKLQTGAFLAKRMFNAWLLTLGLAIGQPSLATEHGAAPNPQRVYVSGPLLWHAGTLNCPAISTETLIVEAYIEELWATQLDVFNVGFSDANDGTHMVQPARWTMSVNTLDYQHTWFGQVTAKAVSTIPATTEGGLLHYNVRAKLYSQTGEADLLLEQLFQIVITANGDLRVFNNSFELSCI